MNQAQWVSFGGLGFVPAVSFGCDIAYGIIGKKTDSRPERPRSRTGVTVTTGHYMGNIRAMVFVVCM